MSRLSARRLLWSMAALAVANAAAATDALAQRTHLLVVTGLGGEPAYTAAFAKQGAALADLARTRWRVADSSLVWLAENVMLQLSTLPPSSCSASMVALPPDSVTEMFWQMASGIRSSVAAVPEQSSST